MSQLLDLVELYPDRPCRSRSRLSLLVAWLAYLRLQSAHSLRITHSCSYELTHCHDIYSEKHLIMLIILTMQILHTCMIYGKALSRLVFSLSPKVSIDAASSERAKVSMHALVQLITCTNPANHTDKPLYKKCRSFRQVSTRRTRNLMSMDTYQNIMHAFATPFPALPVLNSKL